ncbi:hypothetical protein B0I35DRAFT_420921 [Stachybotrys elegans]|uniref:Zn(2)-C6 fungal-type domain-containing protein n=1 Tax=Stachybotrys elegans TaxID=80388 RepID=A0A8K0SXQ3_9HYPO|nr:hypothetical protein B0I35DRAFT_420921 [Stachybotrys elegans]
MAPATKPEPSKALACVMCQQRKKKCDRKTPCSICLKIGTPCIPSIPAPARRRRQPTKDILARLERCEEMLRQIMCGYAPHPPAPASAWPAGSSGLPKIRTKPKDAEHQTAAQLSPSSPKRTSSDSIILPSVEREEEEDSQFADMSLPSDYASHHRAQVEG